MAYTALGYSYWTSFHDAYGCLHHAHQQYRLQLPYKSHRTYLTYHIGCISHHITPLVINSLEDGHTHTRIQTFADRSNSKKPGTRWPHMPGLKWPPFKTIKINTNLINEYTVTLSQLKFWRHLSLIWTILSLKIFKIFSFLFTPTMPHKPLMVWPWNALQTLSF